MGIRTRGSGIVIAILFAMVAIASAGRVKKSVALDTTTFEDADTDFEVKVLGTPLSITGLVLASVFLGFTFIEGVLVGTTVYPDYRGHAYRHLGLGLLINGGFLVFFWVSNEGGAVWLAPVVEVEFWFWVANIVSWSAWIMSWSLRVGPDFYSKFGQTTITTAINAANPEDLRLSDGGSGRAFWWGFLTVVMALCATFALFDITTLMLPLGISAIVVAVFWLIQWYLSFVTASRSARSFKGLKGTMKTRYSWLRWFHIFILFIFIFYTVLFILGPGLGAVTDYQGIMIGYVITYGLVGLSEHILFFVFDYNRRKIVDTTAEELPAVGSNGMRGASSSVLGSYYGSYGNGYKQQ